MSEQRLARARKTLPEGYQYPSNTDRIILSEYEIRTGHVAERHKDCEHQPNCAICDGDLFECTICGGAEGSLLPRCPGYQLSAEEHNKNYLDFCYDRGPFAKDGR